MPTGTVVVVVGVLVHRDSRTVVRLVRTKGKDRRSRVGQAITRNLPVVRRARPGAGVSPGEEEVGEGLPDLPRDRPLLPLRKHMYAGATSGM